MTFNEFQAACKVAWEKEGHGNANVKIAHAALLACAHPRVKRQQVLARAWVYYKNNMKVVKKQTT